MDSLRAVMANSIVHTYVTSGLHTGGGGGGGGGRARGGGGGGGGGGHRVYSASPIFRTYTTLMHIFA